MFGKHYESLYKGSMVGSGALVFAVWGYVIANMRPDWKGGCWVELHPTHLAMVIGEKEDEVEGAIARLCEPDPRSRSTEEEGRRLVWEKEYMYRVVNGMKYRYDRRDPEKRKDQNRAAQKRYRAKKKQNFPNFPKQTVSMEERLYDRDGESENKQ